MIFIDISIFPIFKFQKICSKFTKIFQKFDWNKNTLETDLRRIRTWLTRHLKAYDMYFWNFIMSTSLDLNSIAFVKHLRQDGRNHENYIGYEQKIMILRIFSHFEQKYRHQRACFCFFLYANNF